MDYSALMSIEVGKNRIEALGEVEESADLLRYYASTMEVERRLRPPDGQPGRCGGPHAVGPATTWRVRRHQPVQLPDGAGSGTDRRRAARAATPSSSSRRRRPRCRRSSCSRRTSTPACLPVRSTWSWGPARPSARRSRITRAWTGSCSPARTRSGCACSTRSRRRGPGRASWRWAARTRRSCRATPISTRRPRGSCAARSASVARSARPTRRVYVERPVHDELVRLLVEKTEAITVGDPLVRSSWMGPVIDKRAVDRHQAAVSEARRDGTVFVGGERLADGGLERGFYVEPTVVGGLPGDPPTVPRRAVRAADRRGGRSTHSTRRSTWRTTPIYGLTAGVYSDDRSRCSSSSIVPRRASCTSNRRAGATTGAWPGVQAFGGWKGSGSTGKAGLSMYYVAQFMREQSHTIVD